MIGFSQDQRLSRRGFKLNSKKNSNTPKGELRDYGVGAQILLDLGVRDMILLSNTKRNIVGLEGYGLKITEQRPIPSFKGQGEGA